MSKKKDLSNESGLFNNSDFNSFEEISNWASGKGNPTKKSTRRRNTPPSDPDFFKDFKLNINEEIFEFEPWNSEQKEIIRLEIEKLNNSIIAYAKAIGTNKRFPLKDFANNINFIIRLFFPVSNLKIDYNPEERFNELKSLEPDTTEKQEEKKEKLSRGINISKEMREDSKYMAMIDRFITTFSKPRPDENLVEIIKHEEWEIRKGKEKEITEKVFNYFFPNYKYNKGNIDVSRSPNKNIIIKQIQNFVTTMNKSFNNLNKEQHD